jgi:Flp pilus assembly protein TadD
MLVRRVVRLVLAVGLLCVLVGADRPREAVVQMKFGADMAQRGAWKEAEFRFRKAADLAPDDPEILNNLAVACEHNGNYTDAALAYAKAVEQAPDAWRIRENHARFRLFLTTYIDKKAAAPAEPAKAPRPGPAEGPSPEPAEGASSP